MRVLFLVRSLGRGGAERQIVELAAGIRGKGCEAKVVAFYGSGELDADLRAKGIEFGALDKRSRWDIVRFMWRTRRLIEEDRPDVVYSVLPVPNIVAAIACFGLKDIKLVWGIRSCEVDLSLYDWLTRITYRAEQQLSSLADLVVVNSNAGQSAIRRANWRAKRVLTIPNGIDTDYFVPNGADRRRVREEWGVGPAEVVVGIVARLDPIKDHKTFLHVASLLSDENDVVEWRFVCVGSGPEEYVQRLKRLARDLHIQDKVIWLGGRHDMACVYNALDLVCLTSSSEGFPNVLAEAMACGVQCVSTDVGDARAIIDRFGCLVPPGDPLAFASAIHDALNTKNRESASAPNERRAHIVAQYSVGALVDATCRALRKIL